LARLDQASQSSQRGAAVFGEQCAACHGADGHGNRQFGAPALTDGIWLYAGTREALLSQVRSPKQGVMPAWVHKLGDVDIKIVSLYVHDLGGGE